MIRWQVLKKQVKLFGKFPIPWPCNKMAKVRRNRRLDIMVAIDFLKQKRRVNKPGLYATEIEDEKMFVNGVSFVNLKEYMYYLENGL